MVGVSADVVAALQAALEDQRPRLVTRWRVADHASADLLLVDADSVYGHMDWLKAVSAGRQVVALTISPDAYGDQPTLRLPVVAADLGNLLNRLAGDASASERVVTPIRPAAEAATVATSAPVAEAPTPPRRVTPIIRPVAPPRIAAQRAGAPAAATSAAVALPAVASVAAPAPTPVPAPPPALCLEDLLAQEPAREGLLQLQADGLPVLLLDPRDRTWRSPVTLKNLAPWCARPLEPCDVTVLDEAQFAAAAGTLTAHRHARLQWLVHLLRSDGRLVAPLDPNGRFKLARWPQSEREFPKHFRIATMMLKEAAPLDEIAELAGATVADVANFVNAYHALGYIECEEPVRLYDEPRRASRLFGGR